MPSGRGKYGANLKITSKREFRQGIYLTSHGEEVYVEGKYAKTGRLIGSNVRVPMSDISTKFVREAEDEKISIPHLNS